MRILVTGANGFVGSALIPILKSHGHHIRASVRRPGIAPVPDTVVTGDDRTRYRLDARRWTASTRSSIWRPASIRWTIRPTHPW